MPRAHGYFLKETVYLENPGWNCRKVGGKEQVRKNYFVVIVSPPKSHFCHLGQAEECGIKDRSCLNWGTGVSG